MARRTGSALIALIAGMCLGNAALGQTPPSPPGGTFDRGNAVGPVAEGVILLVIAVTVAGGLAFVWKARPDAPDT